MDYQSQVSSKLDLLCREYGSAKCISIPEAAAFIGVDPDRLRADPNLRTIKTGRFARVALDTLARWMVDREHNK